MLIVVEKIAAWEWRKSLRGPGLERLMTPDYRLVATLAACPERVEGFS
jgi:hypothetical protein